MPPARLIKSEQTHSPKQMQGPVQIIFIIDRILQNVKKVVLLSVRCSKLSKITVVNWVNLLKQLNEVHLKYVKFKK